MWHPKQNLRSRYVSFCCHQTVLLVDRFLATRIAVALGLVDPLSLVLESVWPALFKWNVKSSGSMLRTSHVKPEGLQRSWRVNRKPFVMQKSSSSQQNWEETTDKLSWCTFLATNSFKTNFGIGNISYRKLSSKHFILLALPIGKFFFGKKHIAVLHWLTLTSQPARWGLQWRCDSALRLYIAWQTKHGSHKAAECGWFVSKLLGNLSWFRGIYNIFIIIINPMLRWQLSYWRSCCWFGDGSKPWYLVNPKIAGKWMFIPLKMYL